MEKNKLYKSIAYAYPTSPMAKELGFYDDGCFYIQHRLMNIEGSDQCKTFAAHNAEGFLKATNPDLIALFKETEGEVCPTFLRHGNMDALRLLKA